MSHGLVILHNIIRMIERRRPITALGMPGALLAIAGLGFAYWTVAAYASDGTFRYGVAITATLLILSGVFLSFTSIVLHSINWHLEE
jgi:hypothetical protein